MGPLAQYPYLGYQDYSANTQYYMIRYSIIHDTCINSSGKIVPTYYWAYISWKYQSQGCHLQKRTARARGQLNPLIGNDSSTGNVPSEYTKSHAHELKIC